ncbi:hypothetical protein CR513_09382, partial [Mucuna pruriens]
MCHFGNLATTFNITTTIDKYKLHPNSSTTIVHVLDFPPPPKQIGFSNKIDQGLMACTKSLNFQSIDINDEIDANGNNNDDDEDDCWKKMKMFPPPLSSLNRNGQPSFILVPVRENGRLQLNKVRIKRPEFLCAVRQDGRLRLFLVPDHCVEDDVEEQEQEQEQEQEEQELVDEFELEGKMEEEELKGESIEENEKDVEVVEEITSYEQKDVRIGEWKFPNERFRNCHQATTCLYEAGIVGQPHF